MVCWVDPIISAISAYALPLHWAPVPSRTLLRKYAGMRGFYHEPQGEAYCCCGPVFPHRGLLACSRARAPHFFAQLSFPLAVLTLLSAPGPTRAPAPGPHQG
jgi:hypothetical protein